MAKLTDEQIRKIILLQEACIARTLYTSEFDPDGNLQAVTGVVPFEEVYDIEDEDGNEITLEEFLKATDIEDLSEAGIYVSYGYNPDEYTEDSLYTFVDIITDHENIKFCEQKEVDIFNPFKHETVGQSIIDRIVSIEMDSEFFYNNVSQDYSHWKYDYASLVEYNPEVAEWLKAQGYEAELKALDKGVIDYLEVYRED